MIWTIEFHQMTNGFWYARVFLNDVLVSGTHSCVSWDAARDVATNIIAQAKKAAVVCEG